MSEMATDDYNRAFYAIGVLMRDGMSAKKACDTVTHDFRHLIGNDVAACECLYEEAAILEEDERQAREMADHAYLRHAPRHSVYGDSQAEAERHQELRDAGRGHLVRP